MDAARIHAELEAIFRRVFSEDDLMIHDAMTADEVAKWDSLTHITLILETEKHFGVRFRNAEVARLQNVGDLKRLVQTRLQK